ncbi:flagellar motor switch protein FliN [Nocardioides sp.]|uniref:flagellar motor switch protein FliN n=1 Tax=Nocardioides sp. TaxID=35761 RepID=UPI0027325D6A|nr:flagellar motor switch protein FliN [Nocardioides sp.]MDP3890254.1 flagellar motor switch protein FliN [Nocardioides sp.]
MPSPDSAGAPAADLRAVAAAAAAATVLPSVDPLTASVAQPGNEHVATLFAGAALARLDGAVSGSVAVLVGQELVDALASSPLGGLDLGAATQPALDALAQSLGGTAGAARVVDPTLLLADMGGPVTVVPLTGATIAAAVVIADELLTTTPAAAAPVADVVQQAPHPEPALVGAGAPVPTTPTGNGSVATPAAGSVPQRGIEMLHGVVMDVTVELGRTRMSVRDLLALSPGTVLELDRAAGSPADLLVNGRLIARGEVVVVDEDFGLRLTEIVDDSSGG